MGLPEHVELRLWQILSLAASSNPLQTKQAVEPGVVSVVKPYYKLIVLINLPADTVNTPKF